ncbi:MAG: hypothetical protein IKA89_00730, partial [Anaerotignum sp.]|nr:hypothetical protein [Anaerotignum sp.]
TPLYPQSQKRPFLQRRRQIKVSVKPFQRLVGFGATPHKFARRRFFEGFRKLSPRKESFPP